MFHIVAVTYTVTHEIDNGVICLMAYHFYYQVVVFHYNMHIKRGSQTVNDLECTPFRVEYKKLSNRRGTAQ